MDSVRFEMALRQHPELFLKRHNQQSSNTKEPVPCAPPPIENSLRSRLFQDNMFDVEVLYDNLFLFVE